MRTVVDLVGKRVGRLTVLKQMKIDKIKMCECVCECGNIVIASVNLLWQGNKKSCGCLYKETRSTSAVSHGMSYSPEYRVWNGMKTRCTSVSHKAFKDVLRLHLDNGEMPNKEVIVEIMKRSKLYNVGSDTTYFRRASTIIGWTNWIINQTEE